jgi:ribonuclease HI
MFIWRGKHQSRFCTILPQAPKRATRVPTNRLDEKFLLTHVVESGVQMDLVAYVDGGSLGNPGPAGVGVVIEGIVGERITIAKWIGQQDNNVAEYLALVEALQCALALKARKLHVYSDSEVIVRQMLGAYNCRSPRLYSLHWICRKLARSLEFSISHIGREKNREANRLASSAARTRRAKIDYVGQAFEALAV